MNRKRIDFYHLILVAMPLLLLVSMILTGCPKPPPKPEPPKGPEVKAPEQKVFAWDSVRRAPRWRTANRIGWHKTGEMKDVIDAARKENKPVFLYISKYDSAWTGVIEETILSGGAWGSAVKDNFIAWEIEWWEDPVLAQQFLVTDRAPALVVLKAPPDTGSDELRRVDIWSGDQIKSFPLHAAGPAAQEAGMAKIAGYAVLKWESLMNPVVAGVKIDPAAYVKSNPVITGVTLRKGSGMMPEELLLAQYECLAHGLNSPGLTSMVSTWKDELAVHSVSSVWQPDEVFVKGTGWGIDPSRNFQMMAAGLAVGTGLPVDPAKVSETVKSMLVMQDGNAGGGFPAYIDVRNTFIDGPPYMADNADFPSQLPPATLGPRDIVWVNARDLAWWLKLNRWDEGLSKTCPADKTAAVGFMPSGCKELMDALMTKAGDPAQMKYIDKVYMLDASNEMYQYTGDLKYLDMGGKIAGTFSSEKATEWLEPKYFPILPDLALALHFYGWLGESEDARKAAQVIADQALQYASQFSELDRNRMVYAYEVVKSPCVHASVVGPLTAPEIPELLKVALAGWDPRHTGQVLDPTRDAKLIDAKGYMAQEQVIVFICIDAMCYPPARDTATIKKTYAEITKDLATPDKGDSGSE